MVVKLIGKLQEGTTFIRKGHEDGDELFEFKTDGAVRFVLFNGSLDFPFTKFMTPQHLSGTS